jgi:hypothetical protein
LTATAPALSAFTAEALVVNKAVDLLKLGLQELGQTQVIVEVILFRLDDEYHGEHWDCSLSWRHLG